MEGRFVSLKSAIVCHVCQSPGRREALGRRKAPVVALAIRAGTALAHSAGSW